jgi:hypothetical protein
MYKIRGADQKEYGPVSSDQIRQWIAEHRLNAQSLGQSEGSMEWKPLSEFADFAAALASGPEMRPPTAGVPTLPTLTAYQTPKTNTMAIAGFVLGILSVSGCLCSYGLPANILGLVFSIIGLTQINANPEMEKGKGLAIAGIVLSAAGLLLGGILAIVAPAISRMIPPEYRRM